MSSWTAKYWVAQKFFEFFYDEKKSVIEIEKWDLDKGMVNEIFDIVLAQIMHGDDRSISATISPDSARLLGVQLRLFRILIGSFYEELSEKIKKLIFSDKNILVYSVMLTIFPKFVDGYIAAIAGLGTVISKNEEEEQRRKSSILFPFQTSSVPNPGEDKISNFTTDSDTVFHVEMVSEIIHSMRRMDMKSHPLLLGFPHLFPALKKLIWNKKLINEFFFQLYDLMEVGDDWGEQYVSRIAIACLTAIGAQNIPKYTKRLAGLIRAHHDSVIPLLLVQQYIQTHARESIRVLPLLMDIVVLPCLDSMDYRLRKNSVKPTSELFKCMNKQFPMTGFHQNRQKFAIGTTRGQIVVYDIRSANKWRILDGHTGAISAIGFDICGKHICSYSATDCTVRVWYLASGGVASAGAVVVSGASGGSTQTSVLSGLLGTSGGKCLIVKQLGPIDEGDASGIKHPFNLVYRIQSVKIRWTSDSDILLVRENGQGIQIRI